MNREASEKATANKVEIFYQFLLRAAFGLAVAMACTSHREITSGYYRNHFFVVLGLMTLAAFVVGSSLDNWSSSPIFWFPAIGVIVAYIGTVIWLFQWKIAGKIALCAAGALALCGAWAATPRPGVSTQDFFLWVQPVTSGLALGFPLAAMLLGHWYLNSPGMKTVALERLLRWQGAAVAIRIVFCTASLWYGVSAASAAGISLSPTEVVFLILRWLFGLVGVLILTWMAWRTLLIPNTQSATGILYVSVIGVFAGEMASMLLSEMIGFPV